MKRTKKILVLLLAAVFIIQSCGIVSEPQAAYTPPAPHVPSPSLSPTVSNTTAPDDLSFMPEYPEESEVSDTKDASGSNDGSGIQDTADTQGSSDEAAVKRTYTFRTPQLRLSHFTKHGIDMGFTTEEAYESAAARVITDPRALHKTEAEDGDDVYYIVDTNEFVVLSTDGFIRTYFCPDSGKKYFDKQ